MYSQTALLPWARSVLEHAAPEVLFDAHVHVGIHDPAGLEVLAEEAVGALREVGSRALVFALKEPEGYREANAAMADLAARHDDLLALARLDPADDPLGELERCLDRGAVGLKLHPRGEGFSLDDPRLDGVFALAHERSLPIMVHAGAGDQAIGPHAIDRAKAHPGARLILAHAAIGAHEQVLRRLHEVPNVLFDPSWWNPAELWSLFRRVPPCRIVHASDIPFASPALALVMTGRMAVEAGLSPEQQRAVLGGQLQRVVAGEELLDLGPAPDAPVPLHPQLERLYVTLCTIVERMLDGREAGPAMELVAAACEDPEGPYAVVLRHIGRLCAMAADAQPDPLRTQRTAGWDLVLAAAFVARTPGAPLPELP